LLLVVDPLPSINKINVLERGHHTRQSDRKDLFCLINPLENLRDVLRHDKRAELWGLYFVEEKSRLVSNRFHDYGI